MNKSTMRKKYLSQRLALSKGEHKQLNNQLINMFFRSVDLSAVNYLHIFLTITKFKEVDTWQIIDQIGLKFSKIKFVIPKVVGNNLEHYLFEDKKQLAEDKWGIPEPKYGEVIMPNQIEIVLVPLIIADRLGNRVGYGKGYYDRFLKDCKPDTHKIGLSLLPLAEETIDSEATDVKLDGCITPSSYIYFR